MDVVFIENLVIETVIGIYGWERKIKQKVAFDIEMSTDIRPAAATDTIDEALDYKAVAKRIISFVENSDFQLVETMAERVAEIIIKEFGVKKVKLKLSKPAAVSGSDAVGVMIERGEAS
ncbi:dihydroneopterin aldolase [Pleionea sp. CnH1-48]|uniref:dihydroneopterin aldolase n=1 Tax=Pleionea sp. CnH1-48 TaxID=2954494 RepID=UPI002097B89C|nr:dihydroneopterin aldolase [Pleionea sp. CnH1-48]MCO7225617.1 dihydroneopterin aldolase [Pleionea sp. CnH1-48]